MAVAQRFVCRECERESLRWEGRCPGCEAWNSLDPILAPPASRRGRGPSGGEAGSPRPLREDSGQELPRLRIGLGDLDQVFGGGLVPGSIALLGGAPGIGKSTLLLQVAARVSAEGGSVLYVSGEESESQVRRRARRLGGAAGDVLFLAATSVDRITAAAEAVGPDLLCVDSIQTAMCDEVDSAPGSAVQVRDSSNALRVFAKRSGVPTVLIGHVTKGGAIAGPRTLEHLVDVVLHVEGIRGEDARVLRATKNRFGRVGELAVFRMAERGLSPVDDPGRALLSQGPRGPGSAVTATLEGARPLALEVQALSARSSLPVPRRMTTGFPQRRLAMLLAVLDRRGGVTLERSEVFVNVVGGLRVADPAADAGVLAALVSAELDRALPAGVAFIGEAGLSGELRGGGEREARVRELARVGITDVVLPTGQEGASVVAEPPPGLTLHPVESVGELVRWVHRHSDPDIGAPGARRS